MPDGRNVTYDDPTGIWMIPASGEGTPPRIAALSGRRLSVLDVSPNGRDLVVGAEANADAPRRELLLMSVADGKTRPLMANQSAAWQARFSPDGRWMAYAADPTGTMEIYARPVDGSDAAVRLSTGGGQNLLWCRDGQELYFLSPTDEVTAVDVSALARRGAPGRQQVLFRMPINRITADTYAPYAVTADGQRFLVNTPTTPVPLTLIQLPRR